MWVTEDGRCNTVSLPDPAYVLSNEALRSWNQLLAGGHESEIEALLDTRWDAFMDLYPHVPDPDATFVGEAPPYEILDSLFESVEQLDQALDALEHRWYIDAVDALRDLLEASDRVQYESSSWIRQFLGRLRQM